MFEARCACTILCTLAHPQLADARGQAGPENSIDAACHCRRCLAADDACAQPSQQQQH